MKKIMALAVALLCIISYSSIALANDGDDHGNGQDGSQIVTTQGNGKGNMAAKAQLSNGAGKVIANLERVRNMIGTSSSARVREHINNMEQISARLKNINEDTSKSEIKRMIREMKEEVKQTRISIKHSVGSRMNEKIGGITVKMEMLSGRLERVKNKLEQNGEIVSDVESLIEQFNEKIQASANIYEQARILYAQGNTDESRVSEANQYTRQSKEKLKEAHTILKQILAKINQKNNGRQILETTE